MIVAVIPVKGRLPLIPHTIKQALKVVDKVVCVCDHAWEKPFCVGAETTVIRRVPLGKKWNAGFNFARQFDPDFILYIGSSDWVSENWMEVMLPYAENCELVGVPIFHLLHLYYDVEEKDPYILKKLRCKGGIHEMLVSFRDWAAGEWGGYWDERKHEPIGIGRVLNRDYLKRVDYKPFDDTQSKSMDYQQFTKAKNYMLIERDDIRCLSISTNLWNNYHEFTRDADVLIEPGAFIDEWFPMARELTKWRKVKLINIENGMR
jgi:hypothetical protein